MRSKSEERKPSKRWSVVALAFEEEEEEEDEEEESAVSQSWHARPTSTQPADLMEDEGICAGNA